MKPWMKWAAAGLVLALLVAGTARTLSARKARQNALEAQQVAQKTQVSIALAAADLLQVKALELTQSVAISGPIRAVNTAWVKARVPGELRNLTVREGDAVRAGHLADYKSSRYIGLPPLVDGKAAVVVLGANRNLKRLRK